MLVIYVVLRQKIKTTQESDRKTLEENQLLLQEKVRLSTQREEIEKSLDTLKNQVDHYQSKILDVANQNIDLALDKISENYRVESNKAKEDYIKIMEMNATQFREQMEMLKNEKSSLSMELKDLRTAVEAAVEARKRELEMQAANDFYRLQLADEDIEEIAKLREVLPFLRDKEPLNKVIYKVYYEKPYTDLIGRVLNNATKTGIYKITNLATGMCYVGQAANIAERWKQHIKRGMGAEQPTRNKLYPAMLKYGVENFTFELIEECERQRLDEREDYWQDYFKAKEFGYSIK